MRKVAPNFAKWHFRFFVTQCFPDEETLYMLYRNYDQDPLFGGNVKCVYGYPIGEFENDSTRFAIKFGGQTL